MRKRLPNIMDSKEERIHINVLAETPIFVTEIAGEYRQPNAGRMRYLMNQCSNMKRWQEVIRKSHTDEPSLNDRNEIDQTEQEYRVKNTLVKLKAIAIPAKWERSMDVEKLNQRLNKMRAPKLTVVAVPPISK